MNQTQSRNCTQQALRLGLALLLLSVAMVSASHPAARTNAQADGRYYPQTGHTLGGTFYTYWKAHGGLPIFGYPISEEFQEKNPDDGKTYTVQYFERNRFEYHPENKGTAFEVLLGLLGTDLCRRKGWVR